MNENIKDFFSSIIIQILDQSLLCFPITMGTHTNKISVFLYTKGPPNWKVKPPEPLRRKVFSFINGKINEYIYFLFL